MKGIAPVLRDGAKRRSLPFAKATTMLYYKGRRGGGVGGALIPRTIAIRLLLLWFVFLWSFLVEKLFFFLVSFGFFC